MNIFYHKRIKTHQNMNYPLKKCSLAKIAQPPTKRYLHLTRFLVYLSTTNCPSVFSFLSVIYYTQEGREETAMEREDQTPQELALPEPLTVNFAAIPEQLRRHRHFVVWRYERIDDELKKP